jgi:DNA polymerase
MNTEAQADEILSLIKDTREHLTYFQELGIEQVEPTLKISSSRATEHSRIQTGASPVPGSPQSNSPSPAQAASFERVTLFNDPSPPTDRIAQSTETFELIHAEVGDCTRCPLSERRQHVVHTEGNRQARLMFVGEAPGADEDTQSRPFVGRAGQLLTKIIEAIGFKREEVLIGNVNRCRPPGNRPPTEEEASTCKPFLLREIAIVQPEVIVVLGNTAMRNLLNTKETIGRLRGKFQDYRGIKVMPTYHPAYLLRDPSKKRETWEDLKMVRDYLDTLRTN